MACIMLTCWLMGPIDCPSKYHRLLSSLLLLLSLNNLTMRSYCWHHSCCWTWRYLVGTHLEASLVLTSIHNAGKSLKDRRKKWIKKKIKTKLTKEKGVSNLYRVYFEKSPSPDHCGTQWMSVMWGTSQGCPKEFCSLSNFGESGIIEINFSSCYISFSLKEKNLQLGYFLFFLSAILFNFPHILHQSSAFLSREMTCNTFPVLMFVSEFI